MLKSFVIRCGQFTALFVATYALALLLVANLPIPPRMLGRTNLVAPVVGGVESATLAGLDSVEAPLDVLFVGSSHAQLAFDPRFFDRYGLKTFTLATPLQTPTSSFYLLQRYAPVVRPKVLVLEVWWEVLASDGVEAATRLAIALPPSRDVWRMLLSIPSPKAWNAGLLRLADRSGRLYRRRVTNPYFATYQDRGFFVIPPSPAGSRRYAKRTIALRAGQLDYLRRTIRFMRGQGTRVVLVVAPVPEATIRNIANMAEIDRTMRALAAEEGVRYVDFNPMMQLDPVEHFHDFGHLTERGAQVFMQKFVEELGGEIGVSGKR